MITNIHLEAGNIEISLYELFTSFFLAVKKRSHTFRLDNETRMTKTKYR